MTTLRALSTPQRLLPRKPVQRTGVLRVPYGGGGLRRGVSSPSVVAVFVASLISAPGATPRPAPPPQGGRGR